MRRLPALRFSGFPETMSSTTTSVLSVAGVAR